MITAQQIQSEVLTAQQALLREANSLVMSKQQIEEHQRDLDDLGFSGVSNGISYKLKNAKRLRDLEDQYSFEYPGLKFIPEEAMAEVCAKYGLARGHVSRYIGDVPQWALDQIKANKRHLTYRDEFVHEHYTLRVNQEFERMCAEAEQSKFTGTVVLEYQQSEWSSWSFGGSGYNKHTAQFQNGETRWDRSIVGETITKRIDLSEGWAPVSNLFIAAPRKDMKVRNNELVLEDGTIATRVEDPIVYLDLPGGCVILAAWGEEGQDPKVFNVQAN